METSLIALGGALIGILLGHFLTRSSQHQQWLRDCRRDEFRELLTVLTKSFATICQRGIPMSPVDPETERDLYNAQANAQMTIRDRIHIAGDMERLDIYRIWKSAVDEFLTDHTFVAFSEKYALIRISIVKAATEKV